MAIPSKGGRVGRSLSLADGAPRRSYMQAVGVGGCAVRPVFWLSARYG